MVQPGVIRGHEPGQWLMQQFCGLVTKSFLGGGIEEGDASGLVGQNDGVQSRLGQLPVAAFRFHHRLLRPLALGHVPEKNLAADDFAQKVINGRLHDLDIEGLAARSLVLLHDFQVFPRLHDGQVVLAIFGGQIGWEKIEIGMPDNLLQGFAQERAEPLVGERENPLTIFPNDVLRQALHQRMVKSLRVLERLADALAFDELSDLAADRGEHPQEVVVGRTDLAAEEFNDGDYLRAMKNRKRESAVHSFFDGDFRAREVLVPSHVHNPGRLAARPHWGASTPRRCQTAAQRSTLDFASTSHTAPISHPTLSPMASKIFGAASSKFGDSART